MMTDTRRLSADSGIDTPTQRKVQYLYSQEDERREWLKMHARKMENDLLAANDKLAEKRECICQLKDDLLAANDKLDKKRECMYQLKDALSAAENKLDAKRDYICQLKDDLSAADKALAEKREHIYQLEDRLSAAKDYFLKTQKHRRDVLTAASQCHRPIMTDTGVQCDTTPNGIESFSQTDTSQGVDVSTSASQCDTPVMSEASVQCDEHDATEVSVKTPVCGETFVLRQLCSQCELLDMAGLDSKCGHCYWETLGIQYGLLVIDGVRLSGERVDSGRKCVIGLGLLSGTRMQFTRHSKIKTIAENHRILQGQAFDRSEMLPRLMDISTRVPPLNFGPLPYYAQVRRRK